MLACRGAKIMKGKVAKRHFIAPLTFALSQGMQVAHSFWSQLGIVMALAGVESARVKINRALRFIPGKKTGACKGMLGKGSAEGTSTQKERGGGGRGTRV